MNAKQQMQPEYADAGRKFPRPPSVTVIGWTWIVIGILMTAGGAIALAIRSWVFDHADRLDDPLPMIFNLIPWLVAAQYAIAVTVTATCTIPLIIIIVILHGPNVRNYILNRQAINREHHL